MRTNFFTSIVGLLLIVVLMASCDNSINNTDIEDTLAPYLELEAITEASNTTLTVQRGSSAGLDSYFAFDVSNVDNNSIISEGMVEGWCLEWDKPIAQNNDQHEGVEAYSTFGSKNWKPANYLMSIKDELKREDPTLTYKEIQVALWSLIDVPRFNIDEVLAAGRMPSRMMTNGQPNFSVDKAKDIVDHVRSNIDEYTYTEATPYLVFARTADNTQNGGFLPCVGGDANQCDGYVSISGFVYVDANSNELKNVSESGIQNTTVTLIDENGDEHSVQTGDNGFYSFVAFTGNEEKVFEVRVNNTTDEADFNEELFDTHLATSSTSLSQAASTSKIEEVNFGFEPKVEELIIALLGSDDGTIEPTITTQARPRKFWKKQIFLGLIEQALEKWLRIPVDLQAEIPKEELLQYLEEIEDLLIEEPFQFGENKLYDAFEILWRRDSDLESLLSELLTAELNVVAGFGTDSPEFNRALLAFGESSAVGLQEDNLPGLRASSTVETLNPNGVPDVESVETVEDARNILRKIEVSETTVSYFTTREMPLVSSLTSFQDAEPLLRAFNLSGGGGGSVGEGN